ncbi:hypothetical protein ACQJBY_070251 [Aegilops geniculata]
MRSSSSSAGSAPRRRPMSDLIGASDDLSRFSVATTTASSERSAGQPPSSTPSAPASPPRTRARRRPPSPSSTSTPPTNISQGHTGWVASIRQHSWLKVDDAVVTCFKKDEESPSMKLWFTIIA